MVGLSSPIARVNVDAASGPTRWKAVAIHGATLASDDSSRFNTQRIPRCCEPGSEELIMSTAISAIFLDSEEHMPDLVDHLGVTTCLSAWKALERGEYKVRCIFEVEKSLHAVKVVGWRVAVCAILHSYTPLTAPLTIDLDTELDIQTFDRFLVHCNLHEDEHIGDEYASCPPVHPATLLPQPPLHFPALSTLSPTMASPHTQPCLR